MRMHFDIATAMLVNSGLTLVVGLSLAAAVSHFPDHQRRAMHIWISGLLLQIPVFLLFAFVGALPGISAIVLANALFAFAYMQMGRAVRVFASGNGRYSRFEIALLIGLVVVPIVFGYIWPSTRWRLGFGAPLLACLSLAVAHSVLTGARTRRAADYLTAGLFVVCALPMLLRALIELSGAGDAFDATREFSRNLFFLTGSGLPMVGTIGFLLMCNDRINDELSRLAEIDSLTGVYNRRTFEIRATEAIEQAVRGRESLSLLAVDIDHFKRVNDELGHECGDKALQRIVTLLRETLLEDQLLSRIGGEEFAVLLPRVDEAEAGAIAEKLRCHLEHAAININGHRLTLHISAGVAALSPATQNLTALLRAADRALYAAKRAGRNRVASSSEMAKAVG